MCTAVPADFTGSSSNPIQTVLIPDGSPLGGLCDLNNGTVGGTYCAPLAAVLTVSCDEVIFSGTPMHLCVVHD